MGSFLRIVSAASALALTVSCVWAQKPVAKSSKQAPQTATIVKNVYNVPLTFVALDKHNRFVPGLTANNVQVYDNGKLQRIQRFDAEGNLPLRVVVLLDISNSITDRWAFEQRAARNFLLSVLKPGRDEALVAGFDTSLHVVQPFTSNYEDLAHAIDSLNPSGGTALYDAVVNVAHNYLGPGTAAENGEVRNVIVLITDGADDQSRYSRDEAIGYAQDAGAVIYTIGTEPTGIDPEADGVLKRFAQQTGGSSYFPISAHDLGSAFKAIETELRHQYVVAYSPNNFVPNGQFHRVEIKIVDARQKHIIVRTRKGYFASPAGGDSGE